MGSHRKRNNKAFPGVNRDGEQDSCGITGKILEGIVSQTIDVMKNTVPMYDAQAVKEHLHDLVDKHFPYCAEDDASKSDEKIIGEKIDEAVTKANVYDKIFHETIAKIKEAITDMHEIHDIHAIKNHLHELVSMHFVREVDEDACKHYDKVFKDDSDEAFTEVSKEVADEDPPNSDGKVPC